MQNDMRDRLAELLSTNLYGNLCDHCGADNDFDKDKLLDMTADYLIANGVILPPCNVGETVYLIQIDYKGKYSMLSCLVDSKITMFSILRAYEEKTIVYMSTDKSKAEQKLKEMRDNIDL